MNNSPDLLDALNNLPIKVENDVVTYVRDVAFVHDGFEVQANIVRADCKRAVLLQILKNGHSSTLDIIKAVKAKLPEMQAAAPPGLKIDLLADQSLFVEAALNGVTGSLAKELGARKIRVNAVRPGLVETEGTNAICFTTGEFHDQFVAQTLLGCIGQPQDIATAVTFLASSDSSWITGETLLIAGGQPRRLTSFA